MWVLVVEVRDQRPKTVQVHRRASKGARRRGASNGEQAGEKGDRRIDGGTTCSALGLGAAQSVHTSAGPVGAHMGVSGGKRQHEHEHLHDDGVVHVCRLLDRHLVCSSAWPTRCVLDGGIFGIKMPMQQLG